jgi:eukaryotic translation initiation factor 2C
MLMDECGVAGDEFQKMLYEHSYQYMRATTPVSLREQVPSAHDDF